MGFRCPLDKKLLLLSPYDVSSKIISKTVILVVALISLVVHRRFENSFNFLHNGCFTLIMEEILKDRTTASDSPVLWKRSTHPG